MTLVFIIFENVISISCLNTKKQIKTDFYVFLTLFREMWDVKCNPTFHIPHLRIPGWIFDDVEIPVSEKRAGIKLPNLIVKTGQGLLGQIVLNKYC